MRASFLAVVVIPLALAACAGQGGTAGQDPAVPQQASDSTLNVAQAAMKGNNPGVALHVANIILARHPHDVKALVMKSRALYQSGRVSEALSAARLAVNEAPSDVEARLALGRALDSTDPKGACAQFSHVLSRQPDDLTTLIDAGVCDMQVGQAKRSVRLLDHAVALFPKSRTARLDDMMALGMTGDYAQANQVGLPLRKGATGVASRDLAWVSRMNATHNGS